MFCRSRCLLWISLLASFAFQFALSVIVNRGRYGRIRNQAYDGWNPLGWFRGEHAVTSKPTKMTKPIQFLHVSKAGGTFFCDCAKQNGLLTDATPNDQNRPNRNCILLKQNGALWAHNKTDNADRHNLTCAEEFSKVHELGAGLSMNENYLPKHGICEQFTNVLIFRDPISRLLSHLLSVEIVTMRSKGMVLGEDNATAVALEALRKTTVDDVISKSPAIVDNYYIRSLLGFDAWQLKPGQVTSTHLDRAKRVLSSFDHVLINNGTLNDQILDHLNLDCSAAEGRSHGEPDDEIIDILKSAWGPSNWRRLEHMNKFDRDLYRLAMKLR